MAGTKFKNISDAHHKSFRDDPNEVSLTEQAVTDQTTQEKLDTLNSTITADLVLGRDYNNGEVQYPNSTTEIYIFKQDTTVLRTVTLVYTDSTKENLSTWTAV